MRKWKNNKIGVANITETVQLQPVKTDTNGHNGHTQGSALDGAASHPIPLPPIGAPKSAWTGGTLNEQTEEDQAVQFRPKRRSVSPGIRGSLDLETEFELLSELTYSIGKLEPEFSPYILVYTLSIPESATEISFETSSSGKCTINDEDPAISINVVDVMSQRVIIHVQNPYAITPYSIVVVKVKQQTYDQLGTDQPVHAIPICPPPNSLPDVGAAFVPGITMSKENMVTCLNGHLLGERSHIPGDDHREVCEHCDTDERPPPPPSPSPSPSSSPTSTSPSPLLPPPLSPSSAFCMYCGTVVKAGLPVTCDDYVSAHNQQVPAINPEAGSQSAHYGFRLNIMQPELSDSVPLSGWCLKRDDVTDARQLFFSAMFFDINDNNNNTTNTNDDGSNNNNNNNNTLSLCPGDEVTVEEWIDTGWLIVARSSGEERGWVPTMCLREKTADAPTPVATLINTFTQDDMKLILAGHRATPSFDRPRHRAVHFPYFSIILSIILIISFIITISYKTPVPLQQNPMGGISMRSLSESGACWPTLLYEGHVYNVATALFIPVGGFRLIVDLTVIFWYMRKVENKYGFSRTMMFFFYCGIGGHLFAATMTPRWVTTGPGPALASINVLVLGKLLIGKAKWTQSKVFDVTLAFIAITCAFVLGGFPGSGVWSQVGGLVFGVPAVLCISGSADRGLTKLRVYAIIAGCVLFIVVVCVFATTFPLDASRCPSCERVCYDAYDWCGPHLNMSS